MLKFESKSLKRAFDSIIFSEGVVGTSVAATDPVKDLSTSQGSKSAASAKEAKIAVTKAKGSNAVTIEEAYANSVKLDKKKIIVRGKVVKVSAGIMGKNWIHIQDGTGSQAKGDFNLVCTSSDKPKVGAVVTISGKLAKDRDFGSGYLYAVILEDSKVK